MREAAKGPWVGDTKGFVNVQGVFETAVVPPLMLLTVYLPEPLGTNSVLGTPLMRITRTVWSSVGTGVLAEIGWVLDVGRREVKV